MANATKYVDNVNGNNGNTGNSEAQAYADLATALAAITGGGNTIYIQAGANYTYTATETFPASLKGDTTDGRNKLIGYTTTPGVADGRPIITSATNSVSLFTLNDNDFWELKHLNFTHTAGTRGAAVTFVTTASSPLHFSDCVVDGCLTFISGNLAGSYHLRAIEIKNTTSTISALTTDTANSILFYLYGCDIHDNTGDGIRLSGQSETVNLQDCIFDTNAIGLNLTTTAGASTIVAHGCVFVDNTSDAIKIAATSNAAGLTPELQNNIFWGNTGADINNLDEQAIADANARINRNNASGNNGAARVGLSAGTGDVTLSSIDPFTNRSGRDFTPNAVVGGGLLLRNAAFPGTFVSGTTIDYKDIGIQSQDIRLNRNIMTGGRL